MATGKKNETEKIIVKEDKSRSRRNPNPVDLNWEGPVEDIYATLKAAYDNKEKNTRWIQIYIPGKEKPEGVSNFLTNKEYKDSRNGGKINQGWLDMVEDKKEEEKSSTTLEKKGKTETKECSIEYIVEKIKSKDFWKEAVPHLEFTDYMVIKSNYEFAKEINDRLTRSKEIESKIESLEEVKNTINKEELFPEDTDFEDTINNRIDQYKKELKELKTQNSQDSTGDQD